MGYVRGLSSLVLQGQTLDAHVAGQGRSGIILRYWLLLVTGATPLLKVILNTPGSTLTKHDFRVDSL